MRFSQRAGITPVKIDLQVDSIDDDLRNSIWNVLHLYCWHKARHDLTDRSSLRYFLYRIWSNFFKYPLDTLPSFDDRCVEVIREAYFSFEWYQVYDFLEFIVQNSDAELPDLIQEASNVILAKEVSAYRFVEYKIVKITSEEEIQSIEDALSNTSPYAGAHAHLKSALSKLSDKQNPDYRNSIKESISALESVCQIISGDPKATLGSALRILETKGIIHAALNKSFSALYGYTSDADGIRHAMLDESQLTFVDAKYMLVACTAFINYLIGKTV